MGWGTRGMRWELLRDAHDASEDDDDVLCRDELCREELYVFHASHWASS